MVTNKEKSKNQGNFFAYSRYFIITVLFRFTSKTLCGDLDKSYKSAESA